MRIHDIPQYRKAFIQYLRRGTPIEISLKSMQTPVDDREPATEQYVWRTQGDDKVRPEHAGNEGRIFTWGQGLEPGEDFGCRCFGEPYYGNKPAREGIVEGDEYRNELERVLVPDNQGHIPNRINIFIGGADDRGGLVGDHPVYISDALNKDVQGYNYYTTYDTIDRAVALIDALPTDVQVNIIGHSYGGDTAAKVVIQRPDRINLLITNDPVSWLPPDYEKVRDGVNQWVNVNAIGTPGSTWFDGERLRHGGAAAGFGRSWDDAPNGFARVYIEAPYNHVAFDEMMHFNPDHGRSPVEILNFP
ncbi:MAG: hypothetical protein K2Q01_04345 [Rickettsiales bacterium]|nr:hypothetical protein [Rickettsiales bacterium]